MRKPRQRVPVLIVQVSIVVVSSSTFPTRVHEVFASGGKISELQNEINDLPGKVNSKLFEGMCWIDSKAITASFLLKNLKH